MARRSVVGQRQGATHLVQQPDPLPALLGASSASTAGLQGEAHRWAAGRGGGASWLTGGRGYRSADDRLRRARAPADRARGRPRGVPGRCTSGCGSTTPTRECELDHRNAFELLTATILSAQTTDVRVNMVTPALFERYPTPEDLAAADPEEVEEIIRSTGFYRAKTRSIMGMAAALVERHGGEVPGAMEDLVQLPGVGRKTANVVRAEALGTAGAAGRHPRAAPVAPAGPHHRDRSGQGRDGAQPDGAGRGAGRVQPAADPARSACLHRPASELRRVRAGRHLPVLPGLIPNIGRIDTAVSRSARIARRAVRRCRHVPNHAGCVG